MRRCWSHDPDDRPKFEEISSELAMFGKILEVLALGHVMISFVCVCVCFAEQIRDDRHGPFSVAHGPLDSSLGHAGHQSSAQSMGGDRGRPMSSYSGRLASTATSYGDRARPMSSYSGAQPDSAFLSGLRGPLPESHARAYLPTVDADDGMSGMPGR